MHTSTKAAIGVLLGGVVLSGLVGLAWDKNHQTDDYDYSDTCAMDTSASDLYDFDDFEVETIEVTEPDTPASTQAEASANGPIDLTFYGYISKDGNDYPIVMYLTMRHTINEISGQGMWYASGKYAYKTTLERYGRGPSSWFTFTGHGSGDSDEPPARLTLQIKHPDGSDFEQWTLSPTSSGFSGTLLNLNTFSEYSIRLTAEE